MTSAPDDIDLLAPLATRALAGDRAALDGLCRALQGPIFRLAVRVLGDPADASDATQEILLQVVTHLSQFRGEGRLLGWAYAVATRHLLRARARRERGRSVEELTGTIEAGLALAGPSAEPEGDAKVLAAQTRLSCTQAMLDCLSREERVAVVLVELLGADDELGARLCEVTPEAFRKRLSRGRARLRPVLEGLCGLSEVPGPCTCRRQARAKQRSGRPPSPLAALPVLADEELATAAEGLGQLRRLGAVFALHPPVGPPHDLWEELRRRVPSVLG